jgi:hypothetical protein
MQYSLMPDRIPSLVTYLITKAGSLRKEAASCPAPFRQRLEELAEELEDKARDILRPIDRAC